MSARIILVAASPDFL
jgi:hypothetical protein